MVHGCSHGTPRPAAPAPPPPSQRTTGPPPLLFAPDGHTLAYRSGGYGSVGLWDTKTGGTRAALIGHGVSSAVFSPDGRTLASSSAKTVHLWDVDLPDQAAALREVCRAVGRDLTVEERST
ncbi:WD40 repeat domain-containing protein [Streptomyces sp. NPDC002851]